MLRSVPLSLTRSLTLALTLAQTLVACGSDGKTGDAALPDAAPHDSALSDLRFESAPLPRVFGGARPVVLKVPKTYDAKQGWPLLLVLHGYGATGFLQETLLGLGKLVDGHGVLLVSPDGTRDATGKQFWNATDACCNFGGSDVDDVGYLIGLIEEISGVYSVDAKRIYVIGHSNGGFMSYRLACERADRIAAIISLAGATYAEATRCAPQAPISVVQIHGDKDDSVLFEGGTLQTGAAYPGAVASTELWAGYDGCQATRQTVPPVLDLDTRVAGAETTVERYDGCPSGIDVELWTMVGGSHLPFPTADFSERCWTFFAAHPKP